LKNIKDNGWESNAEVFPIALGENNSVLEIWGGNTGASLIKGWASIPDNYVTQVPVLTFDRVIGNTIHNKRTMILVDIEGAELFLLLGAKNILENNPKPIWLIEISITEHQPFGVTVNPNLLKTFQIFWDHGYDSFTADQELKQIFSHDINEVVTSGIDTINSDNFIFIEKGSDRIFFDKIRS
jgi:FkbM family methyltransferase